MMPPFERRAEPQFMMMPRRRYAMMILDARADADDMPSMRLIITPCRQRR